MEEKSEKLDAKGDPGAPRVDIVVVPVVLIECNNETSTLFADCLNATGLVFSFKYINYTSLTYNCQVQQNGKCVSECTQLASSDYSLQMFQQIDNKVQSIWTGTSNCNANVNKLVPIDTTIKYCPRSSSQANELNSFTLLAFLLGILFKGRFA